MEPHEAFALVRTGRLPGRRHADGYPTEATLVAAGIVVTALAEDRQLGPFTTYLVSRLDDGTVIGDCGFHHPPNEDGMVEIGYGIAESARSHGYATEAVEALIGFALLQNGVRCVHAETTSGNAASRRVLIKAGMTLVSEHDGVLIYGT